VVLGCGNLLAGDDGVGLYVVRRAREEFDPSVLSTYRVRFVEAGTDGPGIINYLLDCDRAIMVDAVRMGEPPGTVRVFSMDDLPVRTGSPVTLHDIGPRDAVSLAERLYPGRVPPVSVIGVQVASLSSRTLPGMTPGVAGAVARACSCVFCLLQSNEEGRERNA